MNSKINILVALGLFFGFSQINGMKPTQKPKLAIIDRIDRLEGRVDKLEQEVRDLQK